MSGARRGPTGVVGRVGFAVLLLCVLGVVVLVRPGDDDRVRRADAGSSPSGVMPSATPSTPPSEEAFCAEYRLLAAAQGQYVAQPDARGAEILREAADRLLATGVPETMGLPARAGYFVELSGVYGSIGATLAPEAVPGSGDGPVAGASGEFSGWLAAFCPAW